MARRRHGFWRSMVATVALLIVLAGVAMASVPDVSGVIHACYSPSLGTLRVIDTEATTQRGCRAQEQPLDWNVQGRQGQQGPTGPTGPQGKQGPPGPGTTAFATTLRTSRTLFSDVTTEVWHLIVPAGSYLASAEIEVFNLDDAPHGVSCTLARTDSTDADTVSARLGPDDDPTFGDRASLSFMLLTAAESSTDNVLVLRCTSTGGNAATQSGLIVATQVDRLVEQPGPPGPPPPPTQPPSVS